MDYYQPKERRDVFAKIDDATVVLNGLSDLKHYLKEKVLLLDGHRVCTFKAIGEKMYAWVSTRNGDKQVLVGDVNSIARNVQMGMYE